MPGKAIPVFPMFVFDVAVSNAGSSRIAMRKVAVVNCELPSGNACPARAFGTGAAFTPLHDTVYVVSGRSEAAGASRTIWLFTPPR